MEWKIAYYHYFILYTPLLCSDSILLYCPYLRVTDSDGTKIQLISALCHIFWLFSWLLFLTSRGWHLIKSAFIGIGFSTFIIIYAVSGYMAILSACITYYRWSKILILFSTGGSTQFHWYDITVWLVSYTVWGCGAFLALPCKLSITKGDIIDS